jgi:hypothetical protein
MVASQATNYLPSTSIYNVEGRRPTIFVVQTFARRATTMRVRLRLDAFVLVWCYFPARKIARRLFVLAFDCDE